MVDIQEEHSRELKEALEKVEILFEQDPAYSMRISKKYIPELFSEALLDFNKADSPKLFPFVISYFRNNEIWIFESRAEYYFIRALKLQLPEKPSSKPLEERIDFVGAVSKTRIPLYSSYQHFRYLLELVVDLETLGWQIIHGELEEMLLISDEGEIKTCSIRVEDMLIFVVFGTLTADEGNSLLQRAIQLFRSLMQDKNVEHLSSVEKFDFNKKFKKQFSQIIKNDEVQITTPSEIKDHALNLKKRLLKNGAPKEVPNKENSHEILEDIDDLLLKLKPRNLNEHKTLESDDLKLHFFGGSKQGGIISSSLRNDFYSSNQKIATDDEYDEELTELISSKLETIALNILGNTRFWPRYISFKLENDSYRFLIYMKYSDESFAYMIVEGNLDNSRN
jgi:hypothetical protein